MLNDFLQHHPLIYALLIKIRTYNSRNSNSTHAHVEEDKRSRDEQWAHDNFLYRQFYKRQFLFCVNISTPVSVTSKVCSNWAERLPSHVTAVQLSGQSSSLQWPSQIMGSIVKQWPGFNTPIALLSTKDMNIILVKNTEYTYWHSEVHQEHNGKVG